MDVLDKKPSDGYGYVYILSNQSFDKGVLKVGITRRSLRSRISELNSTGVPTSFEVEGLYEVMDDHLEDVERGVHQSLKNNGYHIGKEFFNCRVDMCVKLICNHTINLSKEFPSDVYSGVLYNVEQDRKIRKDKELKDIKIKADFERKTIDSNNRLMETRNDYVKSETSFFQTSKIYIETFLVTFFLSNLFVLVISMIYFPPVDINFILVVCFLSLFFSNYVSNMSLTKHRKDTLSYSKTYPMSESLRKEKFKRDNRKELIQITSLIISIWIIFSIFN